MNFDEIFAIFLESYKELLLDSITGHNPVETPKKFMESYRDVQKFWRQFSKNIETYRNMDGFWSFLVQIWP